MRHRELVAGLAEFLQVGDPARIVFCERPLGSPYMENNVPFPDVLVVRKSYNSPDIAIYEVKASKADYMGDVQSGKWLKYLPLCNRFYFATPAKLIGRSDVPADAGLIQFNEDKKAWSVRKGAIARPCDLNRVKWQSLLFALDRTQVRFRALKERLVAVDNQELKYIARGLPRKMFGALERLRGQDEEDVRVKQEVARALGVVLGKDYSWSKLLTDLRLLSERACFSAHAEMEAIALLVDLAEDPDRSGWRLGEAIAKFEAVLARLKARASKREEKRSVIASSA